MRHYRSGERISRARPPRSPAQRHRCGFGAFVFPGHEDNGLGLESKFGLAMCAYMFWLHRQQQRQSAD